MSCGLIFSAFFIIYSVVIWNFGIGYTTSLWIVCGGSVRARLKSWMQMCCLTSLQCLVDLPTFYLQGWVGLVKSFYPYLWQTYLQTSMIISYIEWQIVLIRYLIRCFSLFLAFAKCSQLSVRLHFLYFKIFFFLRSVTLLTGWFGWGSVLGAVHIFSAFLFIFRWLNNRCRDGPSHQWESYSVLTDKPGLLVIGKSSRDVVWLLLYWVGWSQVWYRLLLSKYAANGLLAIDRSLLIP